MSTIKFDAASVKAIGTDQAKAHALRKAAQTSFKSASKATGNAMIKAALATYALTVAGVLFPDEHVPGVTMTAKDYVKGYGLTSNTQVGLWRNLGRLVVEFGLDPESDLWSHFARAGGASKEDVVAEMNRKGATLDSIVKVLRKHVGPDGKRVTGNGNKSKARTAGDGTASREDRDAMDAIVVTLTDEQRVSAALDMLDQSAKSLDSEAWAKVETRLNALIEREVTIRTKAAKDAAKVPTPITTRKGRKTATTRKTAAKAG